MVGGALLSTRGGPDGGASITLSKGLTTIGRAPTNDVVVDLPEISREHASIRRDAEGYWIADLESRNGTFVDGKAVADQPRRLRNLDRVQLGGTDTSVHWIFIESPATMDLPV